MPCYTIQTVELEPVKMSVDTLKAALISIGESVAISPDAVVWRNGSYDRKTGVIRALSVEQGNRVKRAYSKEIVMQQAKRFGWAVKEQQNGQFQIIKAKV